MIKLVVSEAMILITLRLNDKSVARLVEVKKFQTIKQGRKTSGPARDSTIHDKTPKINKYSRILNLNRTRR